MRVQVQQGVQYRVASGGPLDPRGAAAWVGDKVPPLEIKRRQGPTILSCQRLSVESISCHST